MTTWPMVPLGEVLSHYQQYLDEPEMRSYPKLSVKLYGKGAVIDAPADGASLKMKRHQIAKPGQVIRSEIWGKKGAIGFVPPEGEGALCRVTSFSSMYDRTSLNPNGFSQYSLPTTFRNNWTLTPKGRLAIRCRTTEDAPRCRNPTAAVGGAATGGGAD